VLRRAAADEVNDLKTISFVDRSRVPQGARDDVAIKFNGNTVRLGAEVFNECRKRRQRRKFLVFTVDMEVHE
jgi:hypothetical protein